MKSFSYRAGFVIGMAIATCIVGSAVAQEVNRLQTRDSEHRQQIRIAQADEQLPPDAAARPSGEVGRLGFQFRTLDGDMVVTSVEPGSTAADAGLRTGDRIISIDGQELVNSAALNAYLQGLPRGEIPVVIERGGQRRTLRMPLTAADDDSPAGLGVRVSDDASGNIWIPFIYAEGPAHKAGILPGDRLISINGETYRDTSAVTDAIRRMEPGTEISVRIERAGEQQTFVATLATWDDALDGALSPPPPRRTGISCRDRYNDLLRTRSIIAAGEPIAANDLDVLRARIRALENEIDRMQAKLRAAGIQSD